jgi:hypothetical protein
MSVVSDANTHYALRVNNGLVNRYFNEATVNAAALGDSKKVVFYSVDTIELFFNQEAKYVANADSANKFKVTVERISSKHLAEMVLT